MRPLPLILFALLAVGCTGVVPTATEDVSPTAPSPTVSSPTAAPTSPAPTPGAFVWEAYHSDSLIFSLQLPRGWTARHTGTSEGEVLRASGGDAGSMLMTIDTPEEDIRFEDYVEASFRSLLETDPDAVEGLTLPGGRAARAISPRPDGGVSAVYVFAPRSGHSKWLSFTWDGEEPNPLWHAIAERFNAYSPRPIIPFGTPTP